MMNSKPSAVHGTRESTSCVMIYEVEFCDTRIDKGGEGIREVFVEGDNIADCMHKALGAKGEYEEIRSIYVKSEIDVIR